MTKILKEALEKKYGDEVDGINITSYGTPRVTIQMEVASRGKQRAIWEGTTFRHWSENFDVTKKQGPNDIQIQ